MRGAVLHGARDIRFEERPDPVIEKPTDAVLRLSATCICGSDLWPYRGVDALRGPTPMGHEYCGIVEEVGSAVRLVKRGQFVIGSFFATDNTCPHCRAGYQSSCQHREQMFRAQAPLLRVPLADGTLVATREVPSRERVLGAKRLFETIAYPALMHCKSGADRAGIMSVLYMHFRKGKTIREALEQLSFRYLHIRHGKTGVLDYTFARYLTEGEPAGMSFLEWVQSPLYDPAGMKADFRSNMWGNLLTESVLRRE